ncbi:D-tagatose 3-epimerase [Micromonospora sp. MH33]|uniref:sugar phosphate isomerase/epimerase family protein n=1 Tax=Micromonospora sp. MH33 TaxID=1945509 RepID=UPI000D2C2623|nr:sugar phosphate isomerase/epimerase family protein [Micromonospora sp. MH33]PSK67275.1 D-tagatose 3-epimerase [Micromonospora sp. MH33]
MRFGAHSQMLVHDLDDDAMWIFERARDWGLDALELHVADPETFPADAVRRASAEHGIAVVLGTALNAHNSTVSDDAEVRAKGRRHLRGCVDIAVRVGAPKICGGLHSANGHFVGRGRTADEWKRSVSALREAGEYAGERGVTLTVEPVSRYSGYFLNTAADAVALVDEVGLPSVGVQLDTFHMNIEESHMAEAIRLAGPRLKHFHAVENNRGIPGTGQVPWVDCFTALSEVGYDDLCVFEFFPVDLPVMARRTHTWRPLATSEEVAVEGRRRLSALL